MAGTLYLVATPIGNLGDITLRALEVLKSVDLIACEDTRTSGKLLKHYEIETPVTSYHKFNEQEKSGSLVSSLLAGKDIALITDAGMPLISDPGSILLRECRENGITVTAAPGASAAVTALALSGADTRRFIFEGFLPTDRKEKTAVLKSLREETRTVVFYEAPHRLVRTLKTLEDSLGDRKITLCRELTKKFETVESRKLSEAIAAYVSEAPRGEFVLVLSGADPEQLIRDSREAWEKMSPAEHVKMYEDSGISRKEAMKAAARDRGVTKSDIYRELLKTRDE